MPSDRYHRWFAHLSVMGVGILAAVIPYLFNHRFYFNDDEENGLYPYFLEIGRQLHQWHWPYLTLSTFYGGNLAIDWQYGLYNPVSLLVYWVIALLHDPILMGFLLCGFYIILATFAAYCLGRSFRLARPLAVVTATVVATGNFTIYFGAGGWVPALIPLGWLLGSWAFLQRFLTSPTRLSLLGFVILAYLTVSSGWPQADLMLAVLVAAYLIEMFRTKCPHSQFIALFLSAASVMLMALPAYLPAFFSFGWTNRANGFFSHRVFMPDLGDVLSVSSPFRPTAMRAYQDQFVALPLFYLAWFIWPMAPFLRWEALRSAWTVAGRWPLLAFTALAFGMLFTSEQLGPLRWPVRFLPFFHIGFLLAFLLILNQPKAMTLTWTRLGFSVATLLLGFASSTFLFPPLRDLQVIGLQLSVIFTLLALASIFLNRGGMFAVILVAGMFADTTLTHLFIPKNKILPDFSSSPRVADTGPATRPFEAYSLYVGGVPRRPNWSGEALFAAHGVYEKLDTINGFSALGHRTYNQHFGDNLWSMIQTPAAIEYLFSKNLQTGMRIVDLMRVNSLCLDKEIADETRARLGSEWTPSRETASTIWMERALAVAPLSTLSYATPGVQVRSVAPPTGEMERLQVETGGQGGILVFARLYWPGYRAEWGGEALVVSPLENLFVQVALPPNRTGELDLRFVPPGLALGYAGVVLGVMLLFSSLFLLRHINAPLPSPRR